MAEKNKDDPARFKELLESQKNKLEEAVSKENYLRLSRVIRKALREDWSESTGRNRVRNFRYMAEEAEQSKLYPDNIDELEADDWNNLIEDIGEKRDLSDGALKQFTYSARTYAEYSSDSVAEKDDIDIIYVDHQKIEKDEIISRADVLHLIDTAERIRDKALLATMYEGAFRRTAMCQLDVKHYDDHDKWAKIRVPDRTGVKTAAGSVKPLLWSKGYVDRWLDSHPRPDDDDAALFCSIREGQDLGERLSSQAIYTQFRRIVERSELSKDEVHPHMFRHARATEMRLSSDFDLGDIEQILDWTESTPMHSRYEHLDQEEEAERIAGKMGVDIQSDGEEGLTNCPRCSTKVAPEMDYCPSCTLQLHHTTENWFDVFSKIADDDNPIVAKYQQVAGAVPKIEALDTEEHRVIWETIDGYIADTQVAQEHPTAEVDEKNRLTSDELNQAKEILLEMEEVHARRYADEPWRYENNHTVYPVSRLKSKAEEMGLLD